MRKHRLGKQLLIVLCVVLIVFLAGCRPSPVLEQIIYEQNHQVDPDTETKTMNDDLENEEPDEDIPSRETVDDSEQTKDESHTAALAGDTDTSDDTDAVYDVEYSPVGELSEPDETNPAEGSASETATGSTEAGGDEGGYAPSGEGGESGNDGMSGESDAGASAGEEPTGGGNGDLEGEPDSGSGIEATDKEREMTQIWNESGEELDVPTNVDTVAAPGEAATIVEMLDSNGRLVATSSSFIENSFAQSAFDLSGVSVCWSGDGSSFCDNFDALLTADPDVCFVISGQDTLSEAQIATLNERNIGYVTLPRLDSIAHIEEAVREVGLVLDQSPEGRTNAEDVASNYCSWADNMISQARKNYSTKATTYIERWDPDAYWTIQSTQGRGELVGGSGWGVPICMAYAGNSPLAECMEYAGVINTAADNFYVEPLSHLQWEPKISGESGKYPTSYTVETVYSDTLGVGLGTEAFPAVIVADGSVRDNIWNAEGGNYFSLHWTPGQQITYNSIKVYGIPLNDGSGTFLSTRIQNEKAYQILVNPSGVGSWAKGSVESPLEAVWLASKFQGLDVDVGSMVSDFYSTFYHTGANISAIMPEDWTY